MAGEGHAVERACRITGVSHSGFYMWRLRAPSPRAIRHAWLLDQIIQVHAASRGTYGARRVHAELTLGRGVKVGHSAIEMLMSRAQIYGLPGAKRRKKVPRVVTATDLVDRNFDRVEPDRLWVTDITEHPTREGKLYCCVVLDTFSRRVVGWSIDHRQDTALVTNALGMAITNRNPDADREVVIHSDHGTQGGFNRSSQHLDEEVVDGQASWMDEGADRAFADEVAGRSVASPRGRARVLETGCNRDHERGRCRRRRGVPGGRDTLVPPWWRDATNGPETWSGPLLVVR